ncbi:MAG: ABC transporter permease, partial [Planctomycetia bacterium]
MIFKLIVKNLKRNPIRTILTSLGTMVLVFVVTLVWSVLFFLDQVTTEKSKNLKAIVSEKWQLPSQMPFAYAADLEQGAAKDADDVKPVDSMTWQFYGGSLDSDPALRTRDNSVFAFAMDPRKFKSMMDGLDELTPAENESLDAGIKLMTENKQAVFIGRERLASIDKRVGERIKLYSINYKDIDLEFDIVGQLPEGRYNQSAVVNRDYLNDAIDDYEQRAGKPHPLAEKSLNLVWLRTEDMDKFT